MYVQIGNKTFCDPYCVFLLKDFINYNLIYSHF